MEKKYLSLSLYGHQKKDTNRVRERKSYSQFKMPKKKLFTTTALAVLAFCTCIASKKSGSWCDVRGWTHIFLSWLYNIHFCCFSSLLLHHTQFYLKLYPCACSLSKDKQEKGKSSTIQTIILNFPTCFLEAVINIKIYIESRNKKDENFP